MSVTAVILAALEPEVATAQTGGAVYTDVEAAQISLAISHAKMHANVSTTITPAVVASADAATTAVNTQNPTQAMTPHQPKGTPFTARPRPSAGCTATPSARPRARSRSQPETGSGEYRDWGNDAHELAAMCLEHIHNPPAYAGKVMGLGNVVDDEMMTASRPTSTTCANMSTAAPCSSSSGSATPGSSACPTTTASAPPTRSSFRAAAPRSRFTTSRPGAACRSAPSQRADAALRRRRDRAVRPRLQLRARAPGHPPAAPQQPFDEWECSLLDVADLVAKAREVIASKPTEPKPSEAACRFCKAKAICPALERKCSRRCSAVRGPDAQGRRDRDRQSAVRVQPGARQRMDAVELVELWCKAVRARAEAELLAGPQGRRVEAGRGPQGASPVARREGEAEAMRSRPCGSSRKSCTTSS
jgi:hypothetical protein